MTSSTASGNATMSSLLPGVLGQLQQDSRRRKWASDPVAWAEDFMGLQLWSKQREILYSIRDNHNTAVAAGHSVGKSYVAAVAVMWWIDTHPVRETFIASTAPSFEQVNILWDNIRTLFAVAKERHEKYSTLIAQGEDLGEFAWSDHAFPGNITYDNKWSLKDGTTLGQGRKPPDSKGDIAFQGRHATYLLAIGDEAAGITKDFLDALGNIATGEHNRVLLIANPTDPNCAMAQKWNQGLSTWNLMHISVFDAPTVTHEEGFDLSRAGGMSGWDYINEKKEEWGEDDPRYISRVLGQWAFDSGNTLFSEEDIQKAIRTHVLPDPNSRIELGVDVGRALEGDPSFVYSMQWGEVWELDPETNKPVTGTGEKGMKIRHVTSWRGVPLSSYRADNPGQAQQLHDLARGIGASVIKIDASGHGKGVIDPLATDLNRGNYTVIEVWGSYPSSDKRSYENIRAENAFRLKDLCFNGKVDLDPDDTELHEEMRGVLYDFTDKGARKLEGKDSMKRKGKKSPDRFDAVWYASMDVSHLIDGPLAGVKKGDKVMVNPWAVTGKLRGGPGYPL